MRGAVLAVLGVLFLAGCSLAPDYQVPAAPVPKAYKEGGLWQKASPEDDQARGPWWKAFHDATLDQLEEELERSSPSLAEAVARYDQARALAAEAGAQLLPQIGAAGASNQDRQSAQRPLRSANQPNQYSSDSIGVGATYELDLWGRLHSLAAAGTAFAQASAADLETVRLSLEAELAGDYLLLSGDDAQIRLLNDTIASYDRALKLTKDRYQGHIASGIDVARAETQLSTARAAVADVTARRSLREHAIAALTGRAASDFTLPSRARLPEVPAIPTGLPARLLQRRPDIAAAERRVAAANEEIGAAKAAFYPDITLSGLFAFQRTGSLALLSAPYSLWALGPSLAMPLFTGGQLEAEEAQAVALHDEAAARYRGVVLAAFREVEDQMALLSHLSDEAGEEAAAVKAARRTLDLSLTLYRDGAVSYLDVVVAQTAALEVERAELDIRSRRLAAGVGLIRALGGGWEASRLPSPAQASTE